MQKWSLGRVFSKILCALFLILAGCASPAMKGVKPEASVVAPLFPPQAVMKTGNYTLFLKVNETALRECKEDTQCAIALFNLGFVYAYPSSPLYKQATALQYFEELMNRYPESPWADQAKMLTELMRKNMTADSSRYKLRSQLRSKEAIIKDLQTQIEQFKEVDLEADKRRKELQERIERSRQIDMEMDRKERELLQ